MTLIVFAELIVIENLFSAKSGCELLSYKVNGEANITIVNNNTYVSPEIPL